MSGPDRQARWCPDSEVRKHPQRPLSELRVRGTSPVYSDRRISSPGKDQRVPERLSIDVKARHPTSMARAGVLRTGRGEIHTPAFMPVGTHGAVNGMVPAQLEEQGAEIIVCNAFHLARAPGRSVLRGYESLHKFMGWPRAILTDSGGFQVYRLEQRVVRDDGVEFPEAGAKILWRPEGAVDIQAGLRSGFLLALDRCIPPPRPS